MRNAKYTRMQNVFITGGAGLVGGHVISEVFRVNPQADVTVLVQSMDPRSFFVSSGLNDRVRIVFGDVRDERTVRDGVFNFEADTIFHLAAQPLVNVALVNPRQTWDTNLMGTVNVMEAARTSANVKAVVVASSDKAYGAAKFQPYTEDHPLEGLHPYDTSKSCVDLIARSYAVCYGVPVVVTRFGNIFGPGDLNFNRLVPGAMMALATGRELLIVSDMLGFIGRTLNRPVPHRILNEMRHEIPVQSLSDRKLRDAFGWTPAFTPGHAVRETWEWYEKLFR
jgi:CDP-glucose 4,6-dehydratase